MPLGGQAPGAGDQAGREALQPLDRVSGAAPGCAVGERLGPRAPPGLAERVRERIDAEGEIVRQGTQDGGLARAGAAHAACDRAQELGAALRRGCFAEDVEPVADLHFLDFAEVTIELAKRVVAAVGGLDAAILIEPDGGDKLQDSCAQGRTPARIDRGGVEELVYQPLQFLQRAVAAGAGKRRRQVIDDDRSAPPLGLAALAGVVHDEGIDVRNRPERGFRKAFGGERQRLPRQPFHVAVLAHVDHRMGVEAHAHPRVEGEIAVRRRQVGVVVASSRGRCCSRAPAGSRRRRCRNAPQEERNTRRPGDRTGPPRAPPSAR